ncbi:MAG TPA: hypothetical protein VGD77_09795 [Gemmatimonadaceae bacterium]
MTRLLLALVLAGGSRAYAQHAGHQPSPPPPPADTMARHAHAMPAPADSVPAHAHEMWMRDLGGGWQAMGMAQAIPTMTVGSPWRQQTLLQGGLYLTQPAVMLDLASRDARVVLRTTWNFEGWTQPHGELTFGGWGEGFIDSRHPHTLLHEAMLSANWWDLGGGTLSLSAGKGFAPFGTDDPMARPAVKFPTNHHLSQVLERWTANAGYLRGGWSLEAGLFGGQEPDGPYDFSNIRSFGDSWSVRAARRFGEGFGPAAPWELSASFARIEEEHHDAVTRTGLWNASARHEAQHAVGKVYALLEASRSRPDGDDGYYSVLGEGQLGLGREARHQPYARVEVATRPEYTREGAPGTPGFFRYDHDAHAMGATRWVISTLGYGYDAGRYPASVRPYVELQHHAVGASRGGIDPRALFGTRQFWSASFGARIFLGGGPMRMGSYGALDPMAAAMRPDARPMAGMEHMRH